MPDERTLQEGYKKMFTIEGLGTFELRRPSFLDRTQIAQVRAGYIGTNVGTDTDEWILADIMARINVTATVKPRDLNWRDVYDDEPWIRFYNDYSEWLASFRSRNAGSPPPDQGTGAS